MTVLVPEGKYCQRLMVSLRTVSQRVILLISQAGFGDQLFVQLKHTGPEKLSMNSFSEVMLVEFKHCY